MRGIVCVLLLTAWPGLLTVSDAVSAEHMEAGVALLEITPPVGFPLRSNARPSTGQHDPLYAKALVLRQGDRQAAMVFCDLIGVPGDLSGRVRQLAEKKTGIPYANIFIAATHTHTGPLYFGPLWKHLLNTPGDYSSTLQKNYDYRALLEEKLVKVITHAQAAAGPVKLQAGIGTEHALSFNRRFHMEKGPVRSNPGQLNPDIVGPAGPIDPDVGLVLIRNPGDNRPLASLTVFALRCDTQGGSEWSADYPHFLERAIQDEFGGGFISLFAAGTCGDINHIDVSKKVRKSARQIGEELGLTVKSNMITLKEVKQPSLDAVSRVIQVPLQTYSAEDVARAKAIMSNHASRKVHFLVRVKARKILTMKLRGSGEALPVEVQTFRLSKEFAIAAIPGDVFVELGLAIKKRSPFAQTLVIELANDYPAYIPTRKAFREGSYETVNSHIRPGGGEIIVETAVELLQQLKPDAN